MQKLLDGQGLPLIKPQALRRMAGYEKTRVMLLRQLETQLGVRRPGELKMAIDSQILPVVCRSDVLIFEWLYKDVPTCNSVCVCVCVCVCANIHLHLYVLLYLGGC